MYCKLCEKSFKLSLIHNKITKEIAEDLRVCPNCQYRISTLKNRHKSQNKLRTKCDICGNEINHRNIAPTCIGGGCRGKWYRKQREIKMVEDAISTNNFNEIMKFDIQKIIGFGFNVMITQVEPKEELEQYAV